MDKIVKPTIRVVNLREKDLQFKMHYRYNTILLNKYLKNLTATVMGFCNGKPAIKEDDFQSVHRRNSLYILDI